MKEEKYLPLGTVVLLKDAKKRVMISGYFPVDNVTKEVHDYSSCFWPIGYLDSKSMIVFNKEDIESISCIGYVDEEQKQFNLELEKLNKEKITEELEKQANTDDFTFQNKE